MMFPFLCDLTLKATLMLLVATMINLTLRRSSAAARHRLWSLTMIGLLAIPLLVLVTPAIWTLTVSPNIAAFVPSVLSSPRQVNIESHDPNPPAPASAATTSGGIPLGMAEDPVSADSLHSEAVDV